MCEPRDIEQIITMFESAFPNFKPRELTKEIYWQTLHDIPTEELRAAVLHCLTESGRAFAPSVGEIRGAVVSIQVRVYGIPSALEAWSETCRAYHNDISERRPFYSGGQKYTADPNPYRWSHPLVERVARLLGWPNSFPKAENESIDRAHFLKQYEAELSRYTTNEIELPEVTRYIESQSAAPIKQLAKGMAK